MDFLKEMKQGTKYVRLKINMQIKNEEGNEAIPHAKHF